MTREETYFNVEGLGKRYRIRGGIFAKGREFYALKGVHARLARGRICGLVGESGCGKTTLARILAGLSPFNEGRVTLEGEDLSRLMAEDRKAYACRVQIIFQNPYLSLDPAWTLEAIIEEGIRDLPRGEKTRRIGEALEQVGLPAAYLSRRPARLSGGERQRVAIARALAVKPDFLILDEPTSQLDVSIQAQILELLRGLGRLFPGGMLFISHDLALVSRLAEDLIVLRQGRVVKAGPCEVLLADPADDYTRRLIEAVPSWPSGKPPAWLGEVL